MPRGPDTTFNFYAGLAYAAVLLVLGVRLSDPHGSGSYIPLITGSAPFSALVLVPVRFHWIGDLPLFAAVWFGGLIIWPVLSIAVKRHRKMFLPGILIHYLSALFAIFYEYHWSQTWPFREQERLARSSGLALGAYYGVYVAGQVFLWLNFTATYARTRAISNQ